MKGISIALMAFDCWNISINGILCIAKASEHRVDFIDDMFWMCLWLGLFLKADHDRRNA